MQLLASRVTRVRRLAEASFETCFEAEGLQALAGQFLMLRSPDGSDPLLPRPMSVYRLWQSPGRHEASVLYHVVGAGTRRLAALSPGQPLSILGPLGRGFRVLPERRPCLVAGGIGIAGLGLLAAELARAGAQPLLLYGARGAGELIALEDFEGWGCKTALCTDDGSRGRHGFVTQELEARLASGELGQAAIYACGPTPMLRAVAALGERHGVPTQLALEAHMACGFGICLGCVVPARDDGYRLVCRDGPVFDAREVAP